jgi:hypothetical protein
VEVQLHSYLTPALDAGKWPALLPGGYIPGGKKMVPTEKEAAWAL